MRLNVSDTFACVVQLRTVLVVTPSGPGGEHYLAIEHEGREPTRDHVERLCKRHGLSAPTIAAIIDEVRSALAEWPRLAKELGVTASRRVVTDGLCVIDRKFN